MMKAVATRWSALVLLSCASESVEPGAKPALAEGANPPVPAPSTTCCGCLCRDATWSCTKDVCVDERGAATEIKPEVGLFELAGGDYTSYDGPHVAPRSRVWYSFQPAETTPSKKPLVVLFNGGPGGPALGVLAFNIGYFTFDPDFTGGAKYAPNPHRWTDFANLLYIDQPGTGFSYHLPLTDGTKPPLHFDVWADAADYLRVVMRFLKRHPQLNESPIIIAGESYGGMRATHMTALMLDYQNLYGAGPFVDAGLYNEIVELFTARREDIDPHKWTPSDVSKLFTHHILIQPYLTGIQSKNFLTWDKVPGCIPNGDPLDCDRPDSAGAAVLDHIVSVATDPEMLKTIDRCDITSVEWLHAEQRKGAYAREEPTLKIDLGKLEAVFGKPEPGDRYYVFFNAETRTGLDMFTNFTHGETSLRALHDIPTFITAGSYDLYFGPGGLIPSLAFYDKTLSSITRSDTAPANVARPGELTLVYGAGLAYGGGTRTIRFPPYVAGHSVSHRAPAELKADLIEWLASTTTR